MPHPADHRPTNYERTIARRWLPIARRNLAQAKATK